MNDHETAPPPHVRELTDLVGCGAESLANCFARLQKFSGRLWLDSVSNPKGELGRYSFLTADPLFRLTQKIGGPSPWSHLAKLEFALPKRTVDNLPPFQGGVAGLIGYEAATWLENVPVVNHDDAPTDAISLGLYDWTIACDHFAKRTWLVSQGFVIGDDFESNLNSDSIESCLIETCNDQAMRRANEVLALLKQDARDRSRFTSTQLSPQDAVQTQRETLDDQQVTSNFTSGNFRQAIANVVSRIRAGDSFQVNLAQRISSPARTYADELYLRLRQCNPAPFACFFDGGDFEVASSSPEGFLQVRDRVVETRPIKGTVPRVDDLDQNTKLADQLLASKKDRAENVMIVDLMRNDLSRVCDDDSVDVMQLCELEQYQYVQHLVSVVRGRLRDSTSVTDLLCACFPGGSVTGAPKIEAMRTIAQLEPHRRGPYCGSMGYISVTGDADFNILIRTITSTGGQWYLPAGGGITALSDPELEEQETWDKAAGMMEAVTPPKTNNQSVAPHNRAPR